MNNIIHQPAYCNIEDCKDEASRWITYGEDYLCNELTEFYLCPDHAEMVSPNDDEIRVLDIASRSIKVYELAVYCCSEKCDVCND